MKPEQWIINGEVGTSSKTIWAVMMGAVMEDRKDSWHYGVPHDPDDFSRCWKLLVLFPEWRKRLPEVVKVFPEWTGFVREWDKLTEMFEANLKKEPNRHGYSCEMFDFMQKLIDEGLLASGWTQKGAGSWERDKSHIVTITPETAKTMTANIDKILSKSKSKR